MTVQETHIPGVKLIRPRIHRDHRGYFFESFRASALEEAGIPAGFIQDNQSQSAHGVIRGLHYQNGPHQQAKLVRVLEGRIFDVAVDIRPGSSTFGQWIGMELDAETGDQLYIPRGLAHGFSVLSSRATILYKCDAYYAPAAESGLRFDDPDLDIDWQIEASDILVSEKDLKLPYLKDLKTKHP
ncbi:MAG: dTDP-4-dehydrorhamnose 3,5-epimerase [Bacteroidales bacterium]